MLMLSMCFETTKISAVFVFGAFPANCPHIEETTLISQKSLKFENVIGLAIVGKAVEVERVGLKGIDGFKMRGEQPRVHTHAAPSLNHRAAPGKVFDDVLVG
jgi:hypothetical protein